MGEPLVTVIMPAYQAGRYIEKAIASVQRQTVTDWELLVLDDGSRDDTLFLAKAMAEKDQRIRILPNEQNMGVSRTRNRGLELARGKYIAFLDSDDMWREEKLARQIARLEEEGADLACSSYALVDDQGNKTRGDFLVPAVLSFEGMLRRNSVGCSTVLLRRETAGNARFRWDFYHEDYVMWLELLQSGCKAVGCTEVLVDWRFIPNSRSFNKWKAAGNRWRIYRDYLKLPLGKALSAMGSYTLGGLKKYGTGAKKEEQGVVG